MPLDILVVDDILESRQHLSALVRALGHQVTEVDSGLAALAQLRLRLPDLVLLDLLMPDLDGFEVTRRLRELAGRHWLPVIATSALQGEEHVIHALQSGADDYLSRPVNPALLDAKLRHYGDVLAMQTRLHMRAQRERDILDNILDPVVTLEAAGRVEECNRSALDLALQDGQALTPGASCEALFGIDLQQLLNQRECQLRRANGEYFPCKLGLSEWRESEFRHVTVVLHDLSEQRQIERMKDEFLATVSHELRTPLTSVLGALGLLAGGAAGALPAPALSLAEVARRNGARLSSLIDDILDLTKLEGDRLQLNLRTQPLLPLLQEAIAANQGYAERAGVRLVFETPEQDAGPELRLDAERFLQVLANLLSNAIKHSPAGETVRLSLHCRGGRARISVRDRGPGIAAGFRARMFEKFSQADGTDQRVQGGTGLGLYIARLLVERMGGQISADEAGAPGEASAAGGAVFSIEFPLAEIAAQGRQSLTLPRLLHIDKELANRQRLTRYLLGMAEVEGAASLAQAEIMLSATNHLAPALLIGNPQGQGSADDFCLGLRRLARGAPLLLYGDSVDAAFAQRMGLPWLSPARSGPQELLSAVRQACTGRPSSTEEPR
ncbi:ATP-binding protein [Paucibacter sp. AS339]|uniref:hybrid sensor histidine kinase/response regulator n=1 Tax=Paucibacter hankyongi TaxID=3133434 RepID=UPI0030A1B686